MVWTDTLAFIHSQSPTESPTLTLTSGTPVAEWVSVGCKADGVYTEVIKDQVYGDMLQVINPSQFRNLLFDGFLFDGDKLTGTVPSMLAVTWEHTHSSQTSNTYRCDFFDNLKPFNGGCMWRVKISYGDGVHSMIWMPHIVKCSTLEPKCAPMIVCADESCSECKEREMTFENTIWCA